MLRKTLLLSILLIGCGPKMDSFKLPSNGVKERSNGQDALQLGATTGIGGALSSEASIEKWWSSFLDRRPAQKSWVDEGRVFAANVFRKAEGSEWAFKLGRGGQIFSLSMPGSIGEVIARQRAHLGQWVDDAYFPTIPLVSGCEVDGDIHQAGYYNGKFPDGSRYPDIAVKKESGTVIRFDAWPVHAHNAENPSVCTLQMNNVIIHNRIVDKGNGVIEFTLEFDRYAGNATPYPTIHPFKTSIRQSELSKVFRMDANRVLQAWSEAEVGNVAEPLANMYKGTFAVGNDDSGPGVAWILGSNNGKRGRLQINDNLQSESDMHMHALIARHDVASFNAIDPDESYRLRYYMYIGNLNALPQVADTYGDAAIAGSIRRSPAEAGMVPIMSDGTAASRFWRGDDENRPATATSLAFWLFERFVPGAMPVYLLKKASTQAYMISHNPYFFGNDIVAGATDLTYFLGWTMNREAAMQAAEACADKIKNLNGSALPGNLPVDTSLYTANPAFKFVSSECALSNDSVGADL